jgi:hypothetical protein
MFNVTVEFPYNSTAGMSRLTEESLYEAIKKCWTSLVGPLGAAQLQFEIKSTSEEQLFQVKVIGSYDKRSLLLLKNSISLVKEIAGCQAVLLVNR